MLVGSLEDFALHERRELILQGRFGLCLKVNTQVDLN